jgi:hypothetical protein
MPLSRVIYVHWQFPATVSAGYPLARAARHWHSETLKVVAIQLGKFSLSSLASSMLELQVLSHHLPTPSQLQLELEVLT